MDGKLLDTTRVVDGLQALLASGDRVALEGDNQKQANFLSRTASGEGSATTRFHD
jgi:malonate decarboxylase alpha subunit